MNKLIVWMTFFLLKIKQIGEFATIWLYLEYVLIFFRFMVFLNPRSHSFHSLLILMLDAVTIGV